MNMKAGLVPKRKVVAKGQLLIGRVWRDAASGETLDNLDPTTESLTATIAKASVEETNAAVDAAYEAFEDGPWGAPPDKHNEYVSPFKLR